MTMDEVSLKTAGPTLDIPSPLRLLVTMAVSIFIVEFGIMVVLQEFIPPVRMLENLTDALALTLIEFPILYYLTFRPLAKLTLRESSARKALEALQQDYRRLFEEAQEGILLVNLDDGKILDVNHAFLKMFGSSKESFIDTYVWDVPSFKNVVASKDEYVRLQEKRDIHWDAVPLEIGDGKKIVVEVTANAYASSGKQVEQVNVRDVTAQVEAKKKETEYLKNLENTNKLMVGRELKMIELKKENETLTRKIAPQ
ncbi:MAG: PAS domain S-box protein [Minisyncoccia bacterium]